MTTSAAKPTSAVTSGASCSFVLPPEGVVLGDLERSLLEQALQRTGFNQTAAGTLLGINRDPVRYRMAKYDLRRPS